MAEEVYDLISKISGDHVSNPIDDLVPGQYYIIINKTMNEVDDENVGLDKFKGRSLVGLSIGRFVGDAPGTTGGYFYSSGRGEETFGYTDNAIFSLNAPRTFIARDGGKRTPKRSRKSKSKHRKTRRT